jgi:selenocysteine-specific elongation factor
MIVGTAGHIDHGKTALIRALTGVDTDRLPEEKRRGITIELGFAPLELEGIGTLGVVDVPGHEAFVRTMLAGATGVDIALLVVAADEGVMPQTREHLSILALLGVRAGVVALTKRDLVDEEWLALVADEVRDALAGTPLGKAPVVSVSSTTGEGIADLRTALREAAAGVPARNSADIFRMPIDRAFTVKGTGTVVTGTVWSGTLPADAAVRIFPSGRNARVRGIQSHGSAVTAAEPGRRVALSLAGVEREDVERGGWIVSDPRWTTSTVLRADVALLDDAPPLSPRTRVRFHLGTQDVGARIVARGGALAPGAARAVRIVCESPVLARGGDRFVLRRASPAVTIGGGIITDPTPPGRRARPWTGLLPTAESRVGAMVTEAGAAGLEIADLPVRAGVASNEVPRSIAELGDTVRVVGGSVVASDALDGVASRMRTLIEEFHQGHPLESGLSLQAVRAATPAASPAVVDAALAILVASGAIAVEGAVAMTAGWSPRLRGRDQLLADRVIDSLTAAASEPPSVSELSSSLGGDVLPVLRYLERAGRVVPVDEGRYYVRSALDGLVSTIRSGMAEGREYGPAELRDLVGLSRKYLIPFLEYCDRVGVTERRQAGRVRLGT